MNFKEMLEKFSKNKKNYQYLIVFILVGVVLVIVASFFKGSSDTPIATAIDNKNTPAVDMSETANYELEIKNQLKNILSQIVGVGRVEVMITFQGGEETVPAVNNTESASNTESNNSGEKNSTTQSNESSTIVFDNESDGSTKPLIVQTFKPKVCAAIIVAEGAEDTMTELRITKSVMDLLNLTESKVNVYPMKK